MKNKKILSLILILVFLIILVFTVLFTLKFLKIRTMETKLSEYHKVNNYIFTLTEEGKAEPKVMQFIFGSNSKTIYNNDGNEIVVIRKGKTEKTFLKGETINPELYTGEKANFLNRYKPNLLNTIKDTFNVKISKSAVSNSLCNFYTNKKVLYTSDSVFKDVEVSLSEEVDELMSFKAKINNEDNDLNVSFHANAVKLEHLAEPSTNDYKLVDEKTIDI